MTSWTNNDLGRIGAADELHLAFYAGWPKAMSAITVAKQVFEGSS